MNEDAKIKRLSEEVRHEMLIELERKVGVRAVLIFAKMIRENWINEYNRYCDYLETLKNKNLESSDQ